MKRILMLAAAAAFIGAPALAAKTEHAATKTAPAHVTTKTTTTANIHYIVKDTPDLWRTSEIKGVDVYDDRNEKIGDIDDVLMDQHGNVKGVVIGVGGFLGVGERNIAVPFSELHWQMNTTAPANGQRVAQNQNLDHPTRATLPGVTKDQLQQAPEFKYPG
ncbi:MAG TPA: PRC-barrel domain-containing protein [Micropepsaceae bacterium]|nr:PRC-barrel domain-containing protein [Micropepsaceae bacterium]